MSTFVNEKKKGFTLVEILIVLGIIGIVVFIGISSYGTARKKVQLDVTANTVASIIAEARDKTKAGYYEEEKKTSVCFGFRIEKEGFIELLKAPYDRLATDKKCLSGQSEIVKTGDSEETIVIKNIEFFDDEIGDSMEIFFKPPYAEVEFEQIINRTDVSPVIRIVIGYEELDNPIYNREVIFDVLAGNVYVQKYQQKEESQSLFND